MKESLRFRLKNPNPFTREKAARELVLNPQLDHLNDLLELVQDPQKEVRKAVMEALTAINHEDALPGILQGLLDDAQEIVVTAENAIGQFSYAAVEALLQWVEHPEWPQRVAALKGLHQFDITSYLPACLKLAKDPIWEVRYEAYLALGMIQDPEVLAYLIQAFEEEAHPQAREGVIYGLSSIQLPEAREFLLRHFLTAATPEDSELLALALEPYQTQISETLIQYGLWSPEPQVRALSAALLALEPQALEEHLLPLMQDREIQVRETVAYALFQSQPQQNFWQFVAGLYQPSFEIFETALHELKAYPGPGTGENMLIALDATQEPEKRRLMIAALSEIQYQPATAALVEMLQESDNQKEIQVIIEALGNLRAWRAYEPLLSFLAYPKHEIRMACALALSQIAPELQHWQLLTQISELESTDLLKLYQALSQIPESMLILEQEALNQPQAHLRAAALKALSQLPDIPLEKILMRYLDRYPQPEPDSEDALFQLLAQIHLPKGLLKKVLSWLESREESLRFKASRLLRTYQQELLPDLLKLAQHEIWFVRQAALESLANQQRPEILQLLRKALQDRDRDVQITAMTQLSHAEFPERTEVLIDILENGFRELRAASARVLGIHQDHWALKPLQNALLEDEAAEVRLACAEALSLLSDPSSEEILEEALDFEEDPEAWGMVLEALASLNPSQAQKIANKNLRKAPEYLGIRVLKLYQRLQWPMQEIYPALLERVYQAEGQLQRLLMQLCIQHNPSLAADWLQSDDLLFQMASLAQLDQAAAAEHADRILSLLKNACRELRQEIYRLFARIPDFWEWLLEWGAQESDQTAQQTLIELMTELPFETALPLLNRLLQQGSEQIKNTVVWSILPAVDKLGTERLLQWLQQSPTAQRQILLENLKAFPELAFSILKYLIENSWDLELVRLAVRSLGALGDSAIELLTQVWQRDELALQFEVLQALKRLNTPASIPLLNQAVESAYDNLRAHAFDVYISMGESAIAELRNWAGHENQTYRRDACMALQQVSVNADEQELWKQLTGINSSQASVRYRHSVAMAPLFNAELWPFVRHLRHDPAAYVRQALFELPLENVPDIGKLLYRSFLSEVLPVKLSALFKWSQLLPEQAVLEAQNLWPESRAYLQEAFLSVFARAGMPGMALQGLDAFSALVRNTAACMIGWFKLQNGVERAQQLLISDSDWEVRASLCWALGQLAEPTAILSLQQALQDSHHGVRLMATRALSAFEAGGEILLNLLDQVIHDTEWLTEVLLGLKQLKYLPAAGRLMNLCQQLQDPLILELLLESLLALESPDVTAFLRELAIWPEHPLSSKALQILDLQTV